MIKSLVQCDFDYSVPSVLMLLDIRSVPYCFGKDHEGMSKDGVVKIPYRAFTVVYVLDYWYY